MALVVEIWYNTVQLFQHLSSAPDDITDEEVSAVDEFVIRMYSRNLTYDSVNEARKHMFFIR